MPKVDEEEDDDLSGPLENVFAQKEEMRKKIHSFHHAYLEEVDALIKACINSPPQIFSEEESEYLLPPVPAGCVLVEQKMFMLHCGLDRLANR